MKVINQLINLMSILAIVLGLALPLTWVLATKESPQRVHYNGDGKMIVNNLSTVEPIPFSGVTMRGRT